MSSPDTTTSTTPEFIPVIGFVGLPSAGKSTMLNSLIGRRQLHSGVRRTTTDVKVVGEANPFAEIVDEDHFVKTALVSDDGVKYVALDLPGVADLENKSDEVDFDKMTQEWIVRCDIVLWVSDIKTSFLTKHEKEEFDKVHATLKEHTRTTGKHHEVGIVLSKSDYCPDAENDEEDGELDDDMSCGELSDEEEDTTARMSVSTVREIFGADFNIREFNAIGRIQHTPCSKKLKSFYAKVLAHVPKVNVDFHIADMTDGFGKREQRALLNCVLEHQIPKMLDVNCPCFGSLRDICNRKEHVAVDSMINEGTHYNRIDTIAPYYADIVASFRQTVEKITDEECLYILVGFFTISFCDDENPMFMTQLPSFDKLKLAYSPRAWLYMVAILFSPHTTTELSYSARDWDWKTGCVRKRLAKYAPLMLYTIGFNMEGVVHPHKVYFMTARVQYMLPELHVDRVRLLLLCHQQAKKKGFDSSVNNVVHMNTFLNTILKMHVPCIDDVDPLMCCSHSFLELVEQKRRKLWGDEAEDKLDVRTVVMLWQVGKLAHPLCPVMEV